MVLGYLHKAIKPLNNLRMVEDVKSSIVSHVLPSRRIFYVDVGNLPKIKAEQYMCDIMQRYKNKIVYDANTGEVKDDRKFASILEDFWASHVEKVVEVLRFPHFLADKILPTSKTYFSFKRNFTKP